ncbi:MAG: acyl carrier protein [Alphaproteobacteria bacterium]
MTEEDKSVEQRIIEIVAEKMDKPKEEISLEKSFINDLGADSLDTVELVMDFEDAFDITIPEEDAEKIATIGDAVKYVQEHAGGGKKVE